MLNFVTLFDRNYMSRGLVLYNSLVEHCKNNFNLYVLGMDDVTAEYLKTLNNENIVVITIPEIKKMYPVLERLEKERTRGEFSWTLSSFSIQYVIRQFNVDSCTYIDSDICFYNNPQILLDELGNKSVLITEHNYTPEYDQSSTSGKYCVQFMYFKNNEDGNKVLEYWRSKCEEWCYNRMEDGKFGDQKYLDDWESRFEGIVYNCRNIGCGVAPWNIQKYSVCYNHKSLIVEDKITKITKKLVFYHYHGLKRISENKWCLSNYPLSKDVKELIYKKYIKSLINVQKSTPKEISSNDSIRIKTTILTKIHCFIKYIEKYNHYKQEYFAYLDNIETI